MVNTKTLELTANIVSKINFDKKYPYIYIKNFGDTDVYVAEFNDVIPDADGVTRISAGTVGLIYRNNVIDDVYAMANSNCKIEIIGAYDANLSFSKQIVVGGDEYDDTALRNAVNQKADKADVYTKNETDEKITSKVAEIVANAPEDFDTLKEMSDWIAGHENDAAAMNSAIQTNAGNISDLQTNKANVSDLDNYVEKLEGKGLSTNDYTTAEKEKLANAEITANKVTEITETSTDTEYPSAKAVYNAMSSSSGSPYIYMTQAAYEALTEYEQDRPYWVIYPNSGCYLVWKNGECIDGLGAGKLAGQELAYTNSNYKSYGVCCYKQLAIAYNPGSYSSSANSAFYPNLEKIDFANTVTSIGNGAFVRSPLKEITLPKTLISIGDYAFYITDITEITIPASVTSISSNSFTLSDLTTITINKPKDSISGSPWGATNATVVWTG